MTQDQLKQAVAAAAVQEIPEGAVIGVGTGSTANFFIDALGERASRYRGAVASSEASAARLRQRGVTMFDLNTIEELPVYVDGADEIDAQLAMIKGGGGALTREKIVAAVARRFVCIADASKRVEVLGRFPLPVEIIPMARAHVCREIAKLGGDARARQGYLTDNGNHILDIHGLRITEPVRLESELNQIVGIVANGLFARRAADVLLLATVRGVERFARE